VFDAKSLGVPGRHILEFNFAFQDGVLQFGLGNGPKDPITRYPRRPSPAGAHVSNLVKTIMA
jgi:hypothetical protein